MRQVIVTFQTTMEQVIVYEAEDDVSDDDAARSALQGYLDGDLTPKPRDYSTDDDSLAGWTIGKPCPFEHREGWDAAGFDWCSLHQYPGHGQPQCEMATDIERWVAEHAR